jgi:hypothetical protein
MGVFMGKFAVFGRFGVIGAVAGLFLLSPSVRAQSPVSTLQVEQIAEVALPGRLVPDPGSIATDGELITAVTENAVVVFTPQGQIVLNRPLERTESYKERAVLSPTGRYIAIARANVDPDDPYADTEYGEVVVLDRSGKEVRKVEKFQVSSFYLDDTGAHLVSWDLFAGFYEFSPGSGGFLADNFCPASGAFSAGGNYFALNGTASLKEGFLVLLNNEGDPLWTYRFPAEESEEGGLAVSDEARLIVTRTTRGKPGKRVVYVFDGDKVLSRTEMPYLGFYQTAISGNGRLGLAALASEAGWPWCSIGAFDMLTGEMVWSKDLGPAGLNLGDPRQLQVNLDGTRVLVSGAGVKAQGKPDSTKRYVVLLNGQGEPQWVHWAEGYDPETPSLGVALSADGSLVVVAEGPKVSVYSVAAHCAPWGLSSSRDPRGHPSPPPLESQTHLNFCRNSGAYGQAKTP